MDLGTWEVTGCGGAQPLVHSIPRQRLAELASEIKRAPLAAIPGGDKKLPKP